MVKAVTSSVFDKMLSNRSQNNDFKHLEYIQTCVKNVKDGKSGRVTGVGEMIVINFRALVVKGIECEYIDRYDETDELAMLKNEKFKDYAQYQCLKICEYLKMTRGIEIL